MSGRVAVVAGGAGHLGTAAGEALVELGAAVGVLDLEMDRCTATADSLSMRGPGHGFPVVCDLSDEGSTREAVHQVVAHRGRLDVVVHCAALGGTATLSDWAVPFGIQSLRAWDAALRINLSSAFVLAQVCRDALAASGRGSIVLIGSIYGVVGPDLRLYDGTDMANPAGYAASKGGLLQLARYLSCILAPSIRTNVISPGGVWRNQPEPFLERYTSRTPMQRMATEEDIKGAIAYLASDLSSYVTGQNLIIDGGWTAW